MFKKKKILLKIYCFTVTNILSLVLLGQVEVIGNIYCLLYIYIIYVLNKKIYCFTVTNILSLVLLEQVEVIGGSDKYIAVCRQCYSMESPMKKQTPRKVVLIIIKSFM